MSKYLFTSESVTEGHPDKVCDRISDAVLDEVMAHDPNGRVACEVCCTTGMVMVMGEITTEHFIDFAGIARSTLKEIGYDSPEAGFDGNTCAVMVAIDEQSPDIAMGTNDKVGGAGDQGMMFGYACKETPDLMPLPITLANKMAYLLTKCRKEGIIEDILPDGKTQVTVECGADGEPRRVDSIVISAQHDPDVTPSRMEDDLRAMVINEVFPLGMTDRYTKILINPTGRFVTGGPAGDSGLTGRKIIVDTYGGYARHGGGAFSGKDPTKVDRSASYMARYAAKNVVAAGLAKRCEVQLAYAIGVAHPVSVLVDTEGTGVVSDDRLAEAVRAVFDFRPAAIIGQLGLRRPIYRQLAAYGHIGREDLGVSWEKTDKTAALRARLGL